MLSLQAWKNPDLTNNIPKGPSTYDLGPWGLGTSNYSAGFEEVYVKDLNLSYHIL